MTLMFKTFAGSNQQSWISGSHSTFLKIECTIPMSKTFFDWVSSVEKCESDNSKVVNIAWCVSQLLQCPWQRPKKSELSRWQNSTRKNFPDEVRKLLSRQKKCLNHFSRQIKCVNRFRDQKVHKIAIWSPSLKCMCCFCNIVTILWWHDHTSLMHKLQTFGIIKVFLYHPETFQIIRKLSRLFGNFPDYLETFQTIRKLPSAISRVTCKNFPNAQKLSGWQCHDATMVFVPLVHDMILIDGFSDLAILSGWEAKKILKRHTTCLTTTDKPTRVPEVFIQIH